MHPHFVIYIIHPYNFQILALCSLLAASLLSMVCR